MPRPGRNLFDWFLNGGPPDAGELFVFFDIDADFCRYVDGKPRYGGVAASLKQHMRDKRIEHRQYITRHGQDMPEISEWKWGDSMRRQDKTEN